MASVAQDFTMHSGDTKDITVAVVDGDGNDVALAGCSITWSMARKLGEAAAVTKTTAAGDIAIAGNDFSFTLDAADTADLSGTYYHEAQVTDAGGDIATVTVGTIVIDDDLIT
jgi:hypothetical protein